MKWMNGQIGENLIDWLRLWQLAADILNTALININDTVNML